MMKMFCAFFCDGAGFVTCYMVRFRDGSSDETEVEEKQGGLGCVQGGWADCEGVQGGLSMRKRACAPKETLS